MWFLFSKMRIKDDKMPRNKVGHLGPQEVLEAQIKLLARKDDTLEKAIMPPIASNNVSPNASN